MTLAQLFCKSEKNKNVYFCFATAIESVLKNSILGHGGYHMKECYFFIKLIHVFRGKRVYELFFFN